MIITILLVLLVISFVALMIFSATSYKRLLKNYNKFSAEKVSCNLTGLQLARYMIACYHLKTNIALTDKDLNDCYVSQKDVVVLSHKTANTSNIASLSITAHEISHAVQRKNKNFMFLFSHFLYYVVKIGNYLMLPLIIAGIILLFFPQYFESAKIILLIVLCFFLSTVLLKFVKVPVEFGASKIAYNFLKDKKILNAGELKHAKKMLKVAGQTYVADIFVKIVVLFKKIGNSFRS